MKRKNVSNRSAPWTTRERFGQMIVAAVAVIFGAFVTPMASTQTAPRQTAAATGLAMRPACPGPPMIVTADCVDPRFKDPFIDTDEMRNTPVPHRDVHGGFTGTGARFSFYFPPKEQYQGRFFQSTHQLQTSENAAPGNISFALASGAYWVQTNMGGPENPTTSQQTLSGNFDPAIRGYRVNAAAAKYSRTVAAEMYGAHRTYGYLHGGSGGAYQTITSAEHTTGVWDGVAPYVMGTPNAIPGNFTVRIHALRVLRLRDKFPAIMDAIDPGGSGDPYAGLNKEERGALEEATRMGFPPRGWWNHATLTGGPLGLVAESVPILDPTYIDDFWSKPGYLGADTTSSVSAARIVHTTTVTGKLTGPNRLVLATVPAGDLTGIDLVIKTGAAANQKVSTPNINVTARAINIAASSVAVYDNVKAGDEVKLDNSMYLALQTFHRHNVPTPDMYGWNQFRGPDGAPIYPQRDVLVGPISAFGGTGAVSNGRFNGKMILMQSLMDIDALPWQADWYRTKAEQALGPKRVADNFRLWFTDHAQHTAPVGAVAELRTVSYQGALQQALLDLSAWVERGVEPPASTSYKVVDAQVEVPPKAGVRKGIQPVVELKVNNRERAEVAVGQPVTFSATIEAPPNAGKVVAVEWNFEGAGSYVPAQFGDIRSVVNVKTTHSYSKPGTYFPVLRATSQREGDRETPFGRVQNLGRARVVVK
jgi:hypothetical protein